jgi:hypothetical protein
MTLFFQEEDLTWSSYRSACLCLPAEVVGDDLVFVCGDAVEGE